MAVKILVIEDERSIQKLLRAILISNGYEVVEAATGAEALSLISSHCPDAVLLDLGLPDMDGVELLRAVRKWSAVPVVVLSARTHERDKVEALDLGADDYITKPFEIEELLARIRAALRKRTAPVSGGNVLTSGELKLDPARHEVHYGGERIELTHREFALLQVLMENKSIVLSREKLLELVWDYDYAGETNVVDVYIRYLRAKIDDAYGVKYIHTVRGVGYVFRDA